MKRIPAPTLPLALLLVALVGTAVAKLPAPSDEAKAKAAETAAKTAHAGKVDAYKLCLSMDKVAADYRTKAKAAGKEVKPATETPACADPGVFVYTPPGAASAPAPAPAAAAASAPPAAASKT
ncbi:hypothetical protein [Sphaerotilus sp.]|uniref:hypothetical protein n=1 Tax=Sphaerotilus sp. TaxID=2093942 RepID=UPI002ACE1EB3|nr:hypothetical protein [Sphaerotilus sp.]MDZ7856372.1 hypothetical protein [Sphaerotilus sp.]